MTDGSMRIAVNEHVLEVHDGGNGTAMLLLHGFPLSSEIFDPVRPVVESAGRLITVDLRGFGGSDAPRGGYGMDELADDVIRVADELELDRFVLGGHSMGGYVAFRLAAHHRDRLTGLILIDTRAAADAPAAVQKRREAIATIEAGDQDRYLEDMLPTLVGASTKARASEAQGRLRAIAAAVPDHVLTGCLRGMIDRPDSRGLLADLDLPVLVMVGAEDELIPVREAHELTDALPNARLKMVPEAGHTPTVERPVAAGDALAVFLRELS